MKIIKSLLLCFVAVIFQASPLHAWVWGPSFASHEESQQFLTTHYNIGCEFYNQGKWQEAADEFATVVQTFPALPEAADAYYFLGVSYYQLEDFDFSNWAFNSYLKVSDNPEFFEDAIRYKFSIAERFKGGSKRRLFRMRYSPRWFSARTLALSIYDEIIIAVPNHELAALSLYSKGCLLESIGEYAESIDAFQSLIRRFPKHELAPQSYLKIAQVYCLRTRHEFHNSDILALAQINLRRYQEDFPKDDNIQFAEGYVKRIKETSARGLVDLGMFYERICKPDAAAIYYQTAIQKYPDTRMANYGRERLRCFGYDEAAIAALEPTQEVEEDEYWPYQGDNQEQPQVDSGNTVEPPCDCCGH